AHTATTATRAKALWWIRHHHHHRGRGRGRGDHPDPGRHDRPRHGGGRGRSGSEHRDRRGRGHRRGSRRSRRLRGPDGRHHDGHARGLRLEKHRPGRRGRWRDRRLGRALEGSARADTGGGHQHCHTRRVHGCWLAEEIRLGRRREFSGQQCREERGGRVAGQPGQRTRFRQVRRLHHQGCHLWHRGWLGGRLGGSAAGC
ncbi:MAG: hypothetical protein EOP36_20040, partial [Rubrivivax sp.]